MLVTRHDKRIALLLRDRHRHDLVVEEARLLRGDGLLLRRQRHPVLRFALDPVVGRDVLRGLRHRVDPVLFLHQLVDEAPTDRRVVDRVVARECGVGLRHYEWRATHALDAAGDHQRSVARPDRSRCTAERIETGSTKPVHRRTRHICRQARKQPSHPRDIAIVLAGLVRATVDHVVDRRPVDIRIARHQRLDRDRAEIVGTHHRQRAAVTADRGADSVANESLSAHVISPSENAGRRG